MARKNKPRKSPKTLVKTYVLAGRPWQEKTNLTVIGKPSKTLGKAMFWARARVARKKTDPWSPAAHHGIAPDTFEKRWEKQGFAASPRRRKR